MRRLVRVLFMLSLAATLLSACSKEAPEKAVVAGGRGAPDEEFTDFVTQESDSGLVQWKLMAPKADRYSKRKLILLENPVIEFYDKEGKPKTTLVSDSGEYSEDTHDMLAYGNVVVRSVEGDVLETDSLLWDNARDKILSNSFVKLTRGNDVLTGYGLDCDPNLNSVDIQRDVQALIRDENGAMVRD
jgi:LPS export ABC transporter protein LptC